MMTTEPAETIRIASPETRDGFKKEKASDDSFSGILSLVSEAVKKEPSKAENSKETDSEKTEGEDSQPSADLAVLGQLYELLRSPEAGAEQKEAIASAIVAITDVLEGNGASGNMDIAAFLTGELTLLGNQEKEAILARMPQNPEMAQEPGSAAKEESTEPCSNLCPLENISEQTEIKIQTVAEAGEEDSGETEIPAKKEGTATASPIEEGAGTARLREESAESSQSGDAADAGIREERTEQPEPENLSVPWMEGQTAFEVSAADKGETVGGAIRRLEDILSSYDDRKGKAFEIQLEPERLGKLSITLSMEQEGLKAVIRTKDAKVQSLLASEISALAEKLSENGVQVKRMDVVCGETGSGLSGGQGNGSPDPRQNAGPPWERSFLKIQAAYDSSDSTQYYVSLYEEMLGSTVSYRV
jgi:flagellar hook-length control protein FliK